MKLRFFSLTGYLHINAFLVSVQVRSIGAESDRAYQGGPLEWDSYPILGDGMDTDLNNILLPSQYTSMLDWFAVDLEGEHSAMDGRILQEHSEYVVNAIHTVPLLSLIA